MIDTAFDEHSAVANRVRPFCRVYASTIVVLQAALITALLMQGAKVSPLLVAIFGPTLLGAAMIAFNQPVGRSVFVPAAILQIVGAGFIGYVSLFGILAGFLSQSGPMALGAAIYSGICAFSVIYLGFGILLFLTALRRN